MTHTVDSLIADVLRREGGYVNHRADRGGPTKFGITQKTLSKWLGRPATITEVQTLDQETAEHIYRTLYFFEPRIDLLPEALQPQVFDMFVNHPPRTVVRLLQEVLNLAGFTCDRDGVIGPETRKQAASASAAMGPYLGNALAERREQFYEDIVARDPSQRVFLKGWLKRATEFKVAIPEDQAA